MNSRLISRVAVLVTTLILFSSVSLTADAQRRRAVTRHIAQNSLTGVVTDSSTGEPVAEAVLTMQNITVKANADGEFRFETLAAGTWQIEVDRWGYNATTREIEIGPGENVENFVLELLPFIVLTRTDGTTERYALETATYGYVLPFTGTIASKTLRVCTENPNEPILLEADDIAVVHGPSTRVDTGCCDRAAGEQITIQRKDGSMFDAVMLDSCPPYDMYFIGRSLDEGGTVYSRLSMTATIEYPE